MTLEVLLEMDADTLAKMSDDELKAWFEPMLNVTRPDRAPKRQSNSSAPKIVEYISPQKQALFNLMKDAGLDYQKEKWKQRKK